MNASIHDVHRVKCSADGSLIFKDLGVGFLKTILVSIAYGCT